MQLNNMCDRVQLSSIAHQAALVLIFVRTELSAYPETGRMDNTSVYTVKYN